MNDENFYRSIFENAPVGLALSDEQGRVVDANDYLLKIGGWKREELEGKMASDFYEDGPVARREILDTVMRRGGLDGYELRFKKKDGSSFWASMSLRSVVIDGKRHMIVSVEDISARKQ